MSSPVIHDMTHAAVAAINRLAPYIDAALRPLGFHFVLVITEVNKEPASASYISNVATVDIPRVLHETASAIERGA